MLGKLRRKRVHSHVTHAKTHGMDVDWDDLRTVMCLVQRGSLAGAAEELGVNYTTVARRVRRAEDSLGYALFERLADGYSPTPSALLLAARAGEMEEIAQGMFRQLQGQETELQGPLTVTAPQLLIANFLAPVLDEFIQAYPRVELSVRATNDLLDLTRREADLAIRISREPGNSLKGLRLLPQDSASFGTKAWAKQIANSPEDTIDWIVYSSYPGPPKATDPKYLNHKVRLLLDDMVAMLGAAEEGLGIIRLPMFLGRNSPVLVQLPVLPPQPYPDIWVVAHPDVWPSAKSKAFRDILVKHCKQNRALFVA